MKCWGCLLTCGRPICESWIRLLTSKSKDLDIGIDKNVRVRELWELGFTNTIHDNWILYYTEPSFP